MEVLHLHDFLIPSNLLNELCRLKKKTPSQQKFSTEIVFASPRGSPMLWLRQERVQVSHHFSKRPLHPAPQRAPSTAQALPQPLLFNHQASVLSNRRKAWILQVASFGFPLSFKSGLIQMQVSDNVQVCCTQHRCCPPLLISFFYARTRMPSPMLDPSSLLQSKGLFKIPPILMHLGMFQLSRGLLLRLRHPLKVQQHAPRLFSPRQPRPLKRNRMSAV